LRAPFRPRRPSRLGVLLPEPSRVASPTRAVRLVSDLVDSVAYVYSLPEVAVEEGWWSRRLCARLGYARCSPEEDTASVIAASRDIVEIDVDGSQPQVPGLIEGTRRVLHYHVDSRRGGVLFLGSRLAAANA